MIDSLDNAPGAPHTRAGLLRAGGAFTLVELLVVIGIMGILMAILVPSLGRARERARTVVCAANLHSLGLALSLYLNDYNGCFPRYYTDSTAASALGQGRLWWFGFEANGPGTGKYRPLAPELSPFAPYTDNFAAKIQCPDFPYDDGLFFPKFDHHAASYGYNINLAPANVTFNTSREKYNGRANSVVVFADAVHFDFPPGFNEAHYLAFVPNASQPSGYAHFRHGTSTGSQGQAQMVFLDSHVESQPLTGPTYRIINDAPTGNLTSPDGSHAIYGN